MSKHLTIAGLLLALEAWLGIGFVGVGVGMVCLILFAVLAIVDRQTRRHYFSVAATYLFLTVATLSLLFWSARLGQRRASPVIAAVNRYHSEHGQYPTTLDQLVPMYLPSIPRAGFTQISRHFHYYDERPQLYFSGAGYGVFAYDFPTGSWKTSE